MPKLGLMCLIALDEAVALDLFAIRRAVQMVAPRSVMTIERRPAPPGEAALLVTFDGQEIVVHACAGRIPDREYFEAVTGNLFWPEAADEMARHRAVITMCGAERHRIHGLVRAQAVALTRLAAALAEVTPSVGVHWAGTQAMASPDRLARAAGELSRHLWPVDLWLGYAFFGTDRPGEPLVVGVQTIGAAAYLGFELEVPPFAVRDRIEPIRILFGAVGYLMAHGDVIRDGTVVEVKGERQTRYTLHLGRGETPGLAQLVVRDG